MDFAMLQSFGSFATAVASVLIVFLLWRTVKQMEANVALSKVQTEHRFRPWVGPSNSIKYLGSSNDPQKEKHQFDVVIKNFGELPANNVTAMFKMSTELIEKAQMQNPTWDDKFRLGPLLPNMEKHYWFFIDFESIRKAKENEIQLFVILYFEYEAVGKKNGYGMISKYDPNMNCFIHKDMWVDQAGIQP